MYIFWVADLQTFKKESIKIFGEALGRIHRRISRLKGHLRKTERPTWSLQAMAFCRATRKPPSKPSKSEAFPQKKHKPAWKAPATAQKAKHSLKAVAVSLSRPWPMTFSSPPELYLQRDRWENHQTKQTIHNKCFYIHIYKWYKKHPQTPYFLVLPSITSLKFKRKNSFKKKTMKTQCPPKLGRPRHSPNGPSPPITEPSSDQTLSFSSPLKPLKRSSGKRVIPKGPR